MSILEALEKPYSKAGTRRIVNYIGADPQKFKLLVTIFLTSPYRVTQRAAWPLGYAVEAHPSLIKPHLKKVIQNLISPGVPDAVKRNTVRLLQFIDIPKSLHGLVTEICFELFQNPCEAIAVRVFSMTVLSNMAMKYPELKNELIILIEDQLPYGSPGILSRARKTLKTLKA